MIIEQELIVINEKKRGFNLITPELLSASKIINKFSRGLANLFLQHTSCSLAINENADPDVRYDLENFFNLLVPENPKNFKHLDEGLDDITSHIKNVMIGSSLNIPVRNGSFALGTWQGIYLCEHRNSKHKRKILITIIGEQND